MDSCNIARTTGYLSFIKTIDHQMSSCIFDLYSYGWNDSHLYLSTGSEDETLKVVISSQWELSLIKIRSSSEELEEDDEEEEEKEELDDEDEKEDWEMGGGVVFFMFP